jgi:hypothetical protein
MVVAMLAAQYVICAGFGVRATAGPWATRCGADVTPPITR